LRPQLFDRPGRHDVAAVDDRDAAAQRLGDLQDVGREKHRGAKRGQLLEEILDKARRTWV
jgi:hypothetical protein